jgi:CRISPR/Cas system CSM-associated protein Csm3 (group 7 of RAMP superfamily)
MALAPVFHGGNEKTGSVVLLNRLRFIVDGKPLDVPIISGNQVRGRIRRLLTRDFLELAGFKMDLSQKKDQKLYHTLFAGGVLTEAEEESGTVDLTLKNKITEYVLPVRLLGCSYANQMIEGRLIVSHMLPVCRELRDYTGIDSETSFYQLVTHAFQTRRDELRLERPKDEQAVQMMIEYECFAPGTMFYHEFILETTSQSLELDLSTLYRAVQLWKSEPYIGGKSSVGFGKLKLEYGFPQGTSEKTYLEFIEKNKDKILEALNELRGAL